MFLLDLESNPHPRMLTGALTARAAARRDFDLSGYWLGYLQAMVDATGCEVEEVIAWLDRHEI